MSMRTLSTLSTRTTSTISSALVPFIPYKLNTESGKGYCKHTINENGVIRTEKWIKGRDLGHGMFGRVWLQKEEGSGRLRAVKQIFLREKVTARELQALTELSKHCQYFVQFFGWFENDDNQIHFAMEYIHQGDLRRYIRKNSMNGNRIHERKVKVITKQLLEGLKIMHDNNFCHRDLKPENILVASWSPIVVKISDFGTSKQIVNGTALRTEVGTWSYAAPEVTGLLNLETDDYTNSCDIWSLGCVIYAIMANEDIFPTLNHVNEYIRHEWIPTGKLAEYATSSAIVFIESLIALQPLERLTVQDALEVHWLCAAGEQDPVTPNFLKSRLADYSYTQFYDAMDNQDSRTLRQLCKETTAEMEVTDAYGNTPLHYAAVCGYLDGVQLLLDSGADIEKANTRGVTPLNFAARKGHLEVVKFFLEKGAEKETASLNRSTPLCDAARNGHKEVVELLLNWGAGVEVASTGGSTPLYHAARNGHKEVVELLLERGVGTGIECEGRSTPLHWAAREGFTEVVKFLLEKGADIEATSSNGSTPLHYASRNGQLEMVKLLLGRGATIETPSTNGNTPLHWAAWEGHKDVVGLLLDKGTNIQAASAKGSTPLHVAAKYGKREVAQLLLERGANIETASADGFTPLHYAARHAQWGVVELLLGRGAIIETASLKGYTPLYWIANRGWGADIEKTSANGFTLPLRISREEQPDILEVLLDKKVGEALPLAPNFSRPTPDSPQAPLPLPPIKTRSTCRPPDLSTSKDIKRRRLGRDPLFYQQLGWLGG